MNRNVLQSIIAKRKPFFRMPTNAKEKYIAFELSIAPHDIGLPRGGKDFLISRHEQFIRAILSVYPGSCGAWIRSNGHSARDIKRWHEHLLIYIPSDLAKSVPADVLPAAIRGRSVLLRDTGDIVNDAVHFEEVGSLEGYIYYLCAHSVKRKDAAVSVKSVGKFGEWPEEADDQPQTVDAVSWSSDSNLCIQYIFADLFASKNPCRAATINDLQRFFLPGALYLYSSNTVVVVSKSCARPDLILDPILPLGANPSYFRIIFVPAKPSNGVVEPFLTLMSRSMSRDCHVTFLIYRHFRRWLWPSPRGPGPPSSRHLRLNQTKVVAQSGDDEGLEEFAL